MVEARSQDFDDEMGCAERRCVDCLESQRVVDLKYNTSENWTIAGGQGCARKRTLPGGPSVCSMKRAFIVTREKV